MIRRLFAMDGVIAVCRFRDDGALAEGLGGMADAQMQTFARFAHDYRRIVQGNADQLSMFTQQAGWAPPQGWMVRGARMSVCGVANLVCIVDNAEVNVTAIMQGLTEASRY